MIEDYLYDITYANPPVGYVDDVYYERVPSITKGTSFCEKENDYIKIHSHSFRETDETGYGVYVYEETSVLRLKKDNGVYSVAITLCNPTDNAYDCRIRCNNIIKKTVSVLPDKNTVITCTAYVYEGELSLSILYGLLESVDEDGICGDVYVKNIEFRRLPKKLPSKKPTIYLISDSTVQTYESIYYPQTGWGQVLYKLFDKNNTYTESPDTECTYPQSRIYETDSVIIRNRSIGGRSSKSYIEEGKLDQVLDVIRPCDYMFVQWGHNDATKARPNRYVSADDFEKYLLKYYYASKIMGVTLVLITPVTRRNITKTDDFQISFNEYRQVMLRMADIYRIPILDLGLHSYEYLRTTGYDGSRLLYLHAGSGDYPDSTYCDGISDNTHLSEYGATIYSNILGRLLMDYNRDSSLNRLKSCLTLTNLSLIERPVITSNSSKSNTLANFNYQELSIDNGLGNFLLSFEIRNDLPYYNIYAKKESDISFSLKKTMSYNEILNMTTLPFCEEAGDTYMYYVAGLDSHGKEVVHSHIIEIDIRCMENV